MRIKLLKPFGFSEPGDVLDPDPPVAQLLIDRGVAVAIGTEQKAMITPARSKVIKHEHTRHKNARATATT